MCLDFVTYCYCCRTPWPLRSSLVAVTVGNFAKARLLLSFGNKLCFKLIHFLSRVHQAFSSSQRSSSRPTSRKYLNNIYDYDRARPDYDAYFYLVAIFFSSYTSEKNVMIVNVISANQD